MKSLKFLMSFIAGAYLIYHIATFGVTWINSVAFVLFILSLMADWARRKKDRQRLEKEAESAKNRKKSTKQKAQR